MDSNRSFCSVIFRSSAFLLKVVTSESQYAYCTSIITSSLQVGRRKSHGSCQSSLFIFIRKAKTDKTEFHLHFTNENCVTRPNLASQKVAKVRVLCVYPNHVRNIKIMPTIVAYPYTLIRTLKQISLVS